MINGGIPSFSTMASQAILYFQVQLSLQTTCQTKYKHTYGNWFRNSESERRAGDKPSPPPCWVSSTFQSLVARFWSLLFWVKLWRGLWFPKMCWKAVRSVAAGFLPLSLRVTWRLWLERAQCGARRVVWPSLSHQCSSAPDQRCLPNLKRLGSFYTGSKLLMCVVQPPPRQVDLWMCWTLVY